PQLRAHHVAAAQVEECDACGHQELEKRSARHPDKLAEHGEDQVPRLVYGEVDRIHEDVVAAGGGEVDAERQQEERRPPGVPELPKALGGTAAWFLYLLHRFSLSSPGT